MAKQTPIKTKVRNVAATTTEKTTIRLSVQMEALGEKLIAFSERLDRFESKQLTRSDIGLMISQQAEKCAEAKFKKSRTSVPPDKKTLMTPERLATAKYIGTIIGTALGTTLVMYLAGG